MKQYRLFMLLASVFLLAGLNSCLHEEFSESTLPERACLYHSTLFPVAMHQLE